MVFLSCAFDLFCCIVCFVVCCLLCCCVFVCLVVFFVCYILFAVFVWSVLFVVLCFGGVFSYDAVFFVFGFMTIDFCCVLFVWFAALFVCVLLFVRCLCCCVLCVFV